MNKKIILIYIGVVVIAGASIGLGRYVLGQISEVKSAPKLITEQKKVTPTKTPIVQKTIPLTADIAVPYAAQAPFSNWTVHEESCEEAAIYMYHEFLNGSKYPGNKIPDVTDDAVLRTMKSWQVTNYGGERDLSIEVLGKFAHDYYSLTPHVTSAISEDIIRKAISDGSPVLVPVMTHSLENSMYGPYTVYHILLIKGYDSTGVITNDAGVGNGQNHHYSWNILWQAIDAQTTKMSQGRVMLTLSK